MALLFCGLLGWDLMYEYEKPQPVMAAHPVVHSVIHLMAPAYVPPAPIVPIVATSTATSTIATSTPPTEATSAGETASSTPTQNIIQPTSTSTNRSKKTPRLPIHGIRL
jgi:hypothetical protein